MRLSQISTDINGQADDSSIESLETRDWLESLYDVYVLRGPERVAELLRDLQIRAQYEGVQLPVTSRTPYINTIPPEKQPPYPGDREIERTIKSIIRWNAMAMVVEANRKSDGIGGHISTYASAATLYEVGYNHFFRGPEHPDGADAVFIQGHSAPGAYARAYVEGRLSADQIHNFRRELADGGGLSSYPHPWLMPEFWQFPTVSMGLGGLMSIYQARFMHYLADRDLRKDTGRHVWAFLGDGEFDSPETTGAISLAVRETLDNLIWVVNCNLQRLDGPVRGNGNIVQELEGLFRGSGWNVIKVLWGSDFDELFANDTHGLLTQRATEVVDGEYQKYSVAGGRYIRDHFYGVDERLLAMVSDRSDNDLWRMNLGGHDPVKVYSAYYEAVRHKGAPTVILARTTKGYGLGEAGEGRNITHQQKKLNEDELVSFRDRFQIPISDADISKAPLYRPAATSPEARYIAERQQSLGGPTPYRQDSYEPIVPPGKDLYREFNGGTDDRAASTTMVFVRLLTKLLRDENIGRFIVPIVPDEARTFGMDALFRQVGIYSHLGQLYDPVDSETLLYYKESTDGQILEEGITEAGAMASFIAAGTAYSNHSIPMIPFYIYYSMFGFQRVGDLVYAAADCRTRGFMVGGTAGRTTLPGEGLQHQDGHSHLLFSAVPTCRAYDPAFAYEIAVIVREGIHRMFVDDEDMFIYMTVTNENYRHPPKPDQPDVDEGILRGMYRVIQSQIEQPRARVHLLGSGSILNEVIAAQNRLAENYAIAADVWSVTSYTELRRDALDAERWNMLHPHETPVVPYITKQLGPEPHATIATSDYVKTLPDSVSKWIPGPLVSLGTDGFGRSESRESLRDFFEVDSRYVTLAALHALAREGEIDRELVSEAIEDLDIDPEKANPRLA